MPLSYFSSSKVKNIEVDREDIVNMSWQTIIILLKESPRGKRDGVIGHSSKVENWNWIKFFALLRDRSFWRSATNCVWMNKNSSPKSMTKVYLSWKIMFDMVCEPL